MLTLYGSSETDGSISFGHPQLGLGSGDRRTGEGGGGRGGEKEKGRFETMAGIL